jgi:hypothetical protein
MPGMALQQTRRGVQQERQERTVGLGHVQRAFHSTADGALVAEGIPGDRFQQDSLSQPSPPAHPGGAGHDRRERGGRRLRVVLCEP